MSRYLDTRRKTLPVAVTDVAEQLVEACYKGDGATPGGAQSGGGSPGRVQRPRAGAVAHRVRCESPGIASIFRTVRLLCDLNLLQRIHGLDECHCYSLGKSHGHHLVCTNCGEMERFDNCGVQILVQQPEQRTGFRISAHLVELFGLCPRCVMMAG